MRLVRGEIALEPEKHIGFIVIGDGNGEGKLRARDLERYSMAL